MINIVNKLFFKYYTIQVLNMNFEYLLKSPKKLFKPNPQLLNDTSFNQLVRNRSYFMGDIPEYENPKATIEDFADFILKLNEIFPEKDIIQKAYVQAARGLDLMFMMLLLEKTNQKPVGVFDYDNISDVISGTRCSVHAMNVLVKLGFDLNQSFLDPPTATQTTIGHEILNSSWVNSDTLTWLLNSDYDFSLTDYTGKTVLDIVIDKGRNTYKTNRSFNVNTIKTFYNTNIEQITSKHEQILLGGYIKPTHTTPKHNIKL